MLSRLGSSATLAGGLGIPRGATPRRHHRLWPLAGVTMVQLQLQLVAICFFAVLLLSAVFAISGNDQAWRSWGWPALLLAAAIGLLMVAALNGPD